MMTTRAMTALVFLIAGLLAVVVLVGLVQRILDATGVAVALSSVLTGIVGGSILRGRAMQAEQRDRDKDAEQ